MPGSPSPSSTIFAWRNPNGLLEPSHYACAAQVQRRLFFALARVFNEMPARLEHSFEQVRRFTSDASHELRTPLTTMRSIGEVGLQKDGSREEYRGIIGNMLEETNRFTRLMESLLTLSRADAGQIHLKASVIPAMSLMRESDPMWVIQPSHANSMRIQPHPALFGVFAINYR